MTLQCQHIETSGGKCGSSVLREESERALIRLPSNQEFSRYQTPQPEENRDLTGKSEGG